VSIEQDSEQQETAEVVEDDDNVAEHSTEHSSNHVDDPLLFCLLQLARHWQRPSSENAILSSLPVSKEPLPPELFIQAATKIDLTATQVARPLHKISNLVLPAVLLLKNKQACILLGFEDEFQNAHIISSEFGNKEITIPVSELEENYLGHAILTRPVFRFDARSRETQVPRSKSWFWGTLQGFWPVYGEVAIASIMTNIFVLASPLFVMNVYDRVVPNSALDTLWVLAIGISLVYIFDFILRTVRNYLLDKTGKKADVLMANAIFQQVMGIRMEHQPASTGAMAKNIQEFESLREFFTSATLTALIDFPFVFLFLAVIWFIGGDVAIIPFLAVPLVLAIGLAMQAPLLRIMRSSSKEAAQKNALMVEALTGQEAIRILGAEGLMQHKWEQYVDVLARSSTKSRFLSSIAINLSMFVQQMTTVGVIVYGAHLIAAGEITMGALFASTILTGRAMSPLGKIAGILIRLQQSRISLTTLDQIMALPVERPNDKQFINRPELLGEILFQNVCFRYPEQQTDALSRVSLKIKPGEKVAIVGRIGSGKSTLHKLILGLYYPNEGNILLDGVDVRQLDPADLRKNIGCVPQDTTLFFGTVKENIAMGNPFASDHQILEVAQIAGVNDFASRHPRGLDMMIGEQGKGLSGGQKQMVELARALLGNPSLLLIDEPASNLDRASEVQFINRIRDYIKDKTVLLVTHKSSLLELVDRLIIMESGQIIADGPKADVLKMVESGYLKTKMDQVNSEVLEQLSKIKAEQDEFMFSQSMVENVQQSHHIDEFQRIHHEDEEHILRPGNLPWLRFKPITHIALLLVTLIVGVAIIWASYAELDEVTVGQGKVIPSRQVQIVQNMEGGIIGDVLVKEGDLVQKKEILLHIDDTQFQSSFKESKVHYLSKLIKQIRLQAETNSLPFNPPKRTEATWNELVISERRLYKSRRRSLDAAISILNKQVVQRTQEKVELQAMKQQLQNSVDLLRRELELVKPIVAKRLMSEVEMLRLQRQVTDLEAKLEGTTLAIPRVHSMIKEAKEKTKEPEINFRTEALQELNETNAELARLTESITALEDRVMRTSVRSPVKGTVIRVLVTTTGQVVQAGMSLVEIMPMEDSLLVEAQIRPEDIGFLHPGQEVMVKFTAYDFSIYGGLKGRLEHISADAITNEKDENFYLIQVRTSKKKLGNELVPLPIIPGMVASVDILTGKKTVMDYILKPILKAKNNALRER